VTTIARRSDRLLAEAARYQQKFKVGCDSRTGDRSSAVRAHRR
jgi:short-subunit dehydrogenase